MKKDAKYFNNLTKELIQKYTKKDFILYKFFECIRMQACNRQFSIIFSNQLNYLTKDGPFTFDDFLMIKDDVLELGFKISYKSSKPDRQEFTVSWE